MSRPLLRSRLAALTEHASLHPDLGRALRSTIAFMGPLLLAATGWISFDVSFVAIAAQNIAMVDVRGDYRLRLALVLAMTAVFTGATALGATVAHAPLIAVLATGLVAVGGGLWRHLSSDYGPSLAISSTLVFLIALAGRGEAVIRDQALAAFIGGLWGVLVQVANWPFRPQHPLRLTVADGWLAIADLFDAMTPGEPEVRHARVVEREVIVRTTLDRTYVTLEAARAGAVRDKLAALHLAGARLATRVGALNTAIEALMSEAGFATLVPSLEPALASLANLARSVALAVVSRQPGHLAAFDVRRRHLASLLGVLRARVVSTSTDPAHAQLAEIIRQIEVMLMEAHDTLVATIERADERAAFSLELRDLRMLSLRPLASALNLSLDFDPALLRFTLRLAALTMLGVWVFERSTLPHGYWLPFTVVVVLQPDYGSTRQRAGQRVLGTLAGSVFASALLALQLPWVVLMIATAATVFAFGYFVKRNYALAIFFVTLFIVLLTEARQPVTIAFTIERLASTLAGGALALAAAFVFWPVWERDRLAPILEQTFQANRNYLQLLLARLRSGGEFDAETIAAKRRAETANTAAFSSLRRLTGDPKNRQDGLDHMAALVNGNQRLTRTLNVLALHLAPGVLLEAACLDRFGQSADQALEQVARSITHGTQPPRELEPLRTTLECDLFPCAATSERERWIYRQLTRAATELSAMLVTVQNVAPAGAE